MDKSCLDEKSIADYISGNISYFKRKKILEHIASCDYCLNEMLEVSRLYKNNELDKYQEIKVSENQIRKCLNLIKTKLEQKIYTWKPVDLSLKNVISIFIYKLIQWSTPNKYLIPVLQPVPVLRSMASISMNNNSNRYIHVQKKFNDLLLDLIITNSFDDHATIQITILKNKKIPKNVRLTLIQQGNGIESKLLKDIVSFNDCPFDIYQLIVEQNAIEIGKFKFEINKEGLYER